MMRRLRMRLFGLRCRHVVEILTDYLDGALDPSTVSRIEEHLAACDGCDAALEQFRMTISLTGKPVERRHRVVARRGARRPAGCVPRRARSVASNALGRVAQLARALPLQGRCRGFESLRAHSSLK